MKRRIILSVCVVAMTMVTCFSYGQSGSGETRDLKDFTKVSFGVPGELFINIGSEFKVVMEGKKDILKEVVTEVNGGKLVIKRDNWHFSMFGSNDKITVHITMPEIQGLGVSGSGRAEIKDQIKNSDLSLSVSGSGKIYTGDIMTSNLKCSISGSGDIMTGGNGSATRADMTISGSGNYVGESLKIEMADISISGSGNCTCNVTESLHASVSGSGNVSYFGNPKIDARVSGSGKVRSK
jgi:hypothetical protein